MVAVGAHSSVAKGHLQLIHGLQQQPLTFVLEVLKGRFLQGGPGENKETETMQRKGWVTGTEVKFLCYRFSFWILMQHILYM